MSDHWAQPAVASDLASIGVPDVFAFLRFFVLGGGEVLEFAGPGPLVTDDHTRLDFSVPRSFDAFFGFANANTDSWLVDLMKPEHHPGRRARILTKVARMMRFQHSVVPHLVHVEEAGFDRETVRARLADLANHGGGAEQPAGNSPRQPSSDKSALGRRHAVTERGSDGRNRRRAARHLGRGRRERPGADRRLASPRRSRARPDAPRSPPSRRVRPALGRGTTTTAKRAPADAATVAISLIARAEPRELRRWRVVVRRDGAQQRCRVGRREAVGEKRADPETVGTNPAAAGAASGRGTRREESHAAPGPSNCRSGASGRSGR